MTLTQTELHELAERIRAHAYTWGQSKIVMALDAEDLVIPYAGGRQDPFPGEKAYEFEISTDIRDVTGLERDHHILLIFTPDGRYAKYASYERLPEVGDGAGGPRIYDVNAPEDTQKPYETHGFQ